MGRCAFVQPEQHGWSVRNKVPGSFELGRHWMVASSSAYHPAYVALVLQNFHLERLDAATSVPTLNRNNLAGLLIALPPTKAEQEAIAEALSDADALIESLEQLIAKKRQIKQGAMQELLTGKKRLPGLKLNPATNRPRWE